MIENKNEIKTNEFYAVHKNTASKQVSFQHYHDSYEICFFLNINLEIFIKDTRYEIHDGDVVFINEFDMHRFIYNNTSGPYNRYLINFKKDYILPNLKAVGIECILDYLKDSKYTLASTTLKEKTELESLFKSMIHTNNPYSKTCQGDFQEAASKSYIVLILIRIWELIKNNKPEKGMNKNGKLVQGIIGFIDKNYMTEINLDLLEEKFFIDKFHISHIFKKVTDFSIMEYVQQRRILESQKMLKNSRKEIIDICFDCGFNNLQHFYRVFKKISGITPDKFRKL